LLSNFSRIFYFQKVICFKILHICFFHNFRSSKQNSYEKLYLFILCTILFFILSFTNRKHS
jgi:hypothetical protein